jgi:hypothetical protein
MTDCVLYSSSISLISSAVNSTSHPLIKSSNLSKLVVPTIGAVMNGLLKLQARATWAILMFLFLAIVSTLLITALADSDTGRPPDWDRSVPASLLCGLAKSGCQLYSKLRSRRLTSTSQGRPGDTSHSEMLECRHHLSFFLLRQPDLSSRESDIPPCTWHYGSSASK